MEQPPPDQPYAAPLPPLLLSIAEALVSRWARELPSGVPRIPPVIMLTQAVRDRMRDDLARVIIDTIDGKFI